MASPFIRRGRDPRPRDSVHARGLSSQARGTIGGKIETITSHATDRPSVFVRSVARFEGDRWLLAPVHGDNDLHRVDHRSWERSWKWKRGNFDSAGQEDMTGYAPLQTDAYKDKLDYNIIIIKCHLGGRAG